MSEWSRLSWKLEEGDEEAYGAIADGLWLMKRGALTGSPQLSSRVLWRWGGVGCGALAGLFSSCWDRKQTEEESEVPPSSREGAAERPGLLPQVAGLTGCRSMPAQAILPRNMPARAMHASLPFLLCLFLLVCLTDFRWGSLRVEQARAVLTKLERKVKVFLSLAKEPFSKTPQIWTEWRSSPGNNDFVRDAIPFVSLFRLYPHLEFFFCFYFKTVLIL